MVDRLQKIFQKNRFRRTDLLRSNPSHRFHRLLHRLMDQCCLFQLHRNLCLLQCFLHQVHQWHRRLRVHFLKLRCNRLCTLLVLRMSLGTRLDLHNCIFLFEFGLHRSRQNKTTMGTILPKRNRQHRIHHRRCSSRCRYPNTLLNPRKVESAQKVRLRNRLLERKLQPGFRLALPRCICKLEFVLE